MDNDGMKKGSLTQPFLAWTTQCSTPVCAVVIRRPPWLPWLHSGSFQPIRTGLIQQLCLDNVCETKKKTQKQTNTIITHGGVFAF